MCIRDRNPTVGTTGGTPHVAPVSLRATQRCFHIPMKTAVASARHNQAANRCDAGTRAQQRINQLTAASGIAHDHLDTWPDSATYYNINSC